MNKEIHMAAECMLFEELSPDEFEAALMKFAELVRADERKKWEGQTAVETHEAILDEREACLYAAKVAVSLLSDPIEAIRARGQA